MRVCTPGMLISARDIVGRAQCADERAIRVELSGNLCRCTGYLGIVNAVRKVIEASLTASPWSLRPSRQRRSDFRSQGERSSCHFTHGHSRHSRRAGDPKRLGAVRGELHYKQVARRGMAYFWGCSRRRRLSAGRDIDRAYAAFRKRDVVGEARSIVAAFGGSAVISGRAEMRGVIRGAGNDKWTRSRTKGDVLYRLVPIDGAAGTTVDIAVEYNLQGALAQFSRSSLADELGRRLVADFAVNLNCA